MTEGYHESEQVYTRPAPTDEEREARAAYREHILNAAGGAMKFEAKARRVFRHGPTATMVRQLLFWDGKGADPEGFIWKTYGEWWEEEGLTRKELDTARHKLGSDNFGVLEEQRKGVPCRLFYRLDLGRLMEVMFPELDDPPAEDPVPDDTTLNLDSRVSDSDSQDCTVGAVKSGGLDPSHIREYAKTSSDISTTTTGKKDFSDDSDEELTEEDLAEIVEWVGEETDEEEPIPAAEYALAEIVGRLLSADPDGDTPESAALRLARAAALGCGSTQGPITVHHVADAIRQTGDPDVECIEQAIAETLIESIQHEDHDDEDAGEQQREEVPTA